MLNSKHSLLLPLFLNLWRLLVIKLLRGITLLNYRVFNRSVDIDCVALPYKIIGCSTFSVGCSQYWPVALPYKIIGCLTLKLVCPIKL